MLNSSASLALAKIVRVFFPKVFKTLRLRTFPVEVQKFFLGIVKQTIDFRNANGVRRNDFIQLLLELKDQKDGENAFELTEELIAAQVSYFPEYSRPLKPIASVIVHNCHIFASNTCRT